MERTTDVASLRAFYSKMALSEEAADPDPIRQFTVWFEEAVAAGVPEPNAFTLVTADASGQPSGRIILLKGFDDHGFVFFTNLDSRKGQDIGVNPRAGLVFWWSELERQVRIEGTVAEVSGDDADAYFAERPRESQLGAWASSQSSEVASREVLEARLAELEIEYAGRSVPRPPRWGGYRVTPSLLEFWQGRPSRLHDRLRYTRSTPGTGWARSRLAP